MAMGLLRKKSSGAYKGLQLALDEEGKRIVLGTGSSGTVGIHTLLCQLRLLWF
jgi:hypothetical protein